MSTVFELDEKGWDDRLTEARLATRQPEVSATAGEGIFQGIGAGLMRGGARAVDALGVAAAPFMRAAPPGQLSAEIADVGQKVRGQSDLLDPYYRAVDETARGAVDFWTPNVNEVGKIGQVLGGLSEIVLPLASTAGNPALLIGSQELGTATDLTREGVDPETAIGVGVTQGLATAVGFKLPFLGKTLSKKIATGALGNLLTNTAAAANQQLFLREGGYDQLAENYDPLNVEARAIDVLTGVAFGSLAHFSERMDPSTVAAVAAAGNAKHFQLDTAPGIPLDNSALAAHSHAMDLATEALTRGESVSPPAELATAAFKPRPPREVPIPPELKALDAETSARAPVKVEIVDDENNGKFITAHSASGETQTRVSGDFVQIIETFTAPGARGSGEGTARMMALLDYAETHGKTLISDTKVSPQAARFYERALARGFDVIRNAAKADSEGHLVSEDSKPVFEVHPKDPGYDAARGKPTDEQLKQFQGLRSDVPPNKNVGAAGEGTPGQTGLPGDGGARGEPLKVYRGGVAELTGKDFRRGAVKGATTKPIHGLGVHFTNSADRAADFGKVSEHYLDIRNPRILRGEEIPWFKSADEYAAFAKEMKSEGFDGVVIDGSEFGGPVDFFAFDEKQVLNADRAPAAKKQSAKEPSASEVPPEIAAAHAHLATADLQIPTGEIDADGNAVTRSGRELMAEAEAEIAQAENDAKGYEAAVSCWLTRGPDAN